MSNNKALFFRKVPQGLPKIGEHIEIAENPIDLDGKLEEGSILIQTLYISLDPYMRGRLRDASVKSYTPAFPLNQPMIAGVLGKILKSNNSEFKEGQIYSGMGQIANYSIVPQALLGPASRVLENADNLPFDLPHYLGALGMPGLTAYSSFYDIGQPKKGETILVSAAAGAVGQLVVQLAKHEGLRVIASVGDDEKADFVKNELGADEVYNYKKESPADALKRLAPDGIDIFYDNVGGDTLVAALDAMKDFGRVVVCGAISQYNLTADERTPIRNLSMALVTKRLTVRGFIVSDPNMGPKYFKDHQEKVYKWLADGSFKAKLDVSQGVDSAGEALLSLFSGKNKGKVVVKV